MIGVEVQRSVNGIVPLQVAAEILLLSLISTVTTICIILLVFYLAKYTNFLNTSEDHEIRMPSDSSELFLLLKDWKPDNYRTLLSSFLLQDEYIVLEKLLSCLEKDGIRSSIYEGNIELIGEGGWRNRNQIAKQTELSNRRVYGKKGIIDRLVGLELVEERENHQPWGRQTMQYRANVRHLLVKSMFCSLRSGAFKSQSSASPE